MGDERRTTWWEQINRPIVVVIVAAMLLPFAIKATDMLTTRHEDYGEPRSEPDRVEIELVARIGYWLRRVKRPDYGEDVKVYEPDLRQMLAEPYGIETSYRWAAYSEFKFETLWALLAKVDQDGDDAQREKANKTRWALRRAIEIIDEITLVEAAARPALHQELLDVCEGVFGDDS